MIKYQAIAKPRGQDSWGAGHYGASRGKRKHAGEDFNMPAGAMVYSLRAGTITKFGTVYKSDSRYRYVQVTDKYGYKLRYYYVNLIGRVGDKIPADTVIGTLQDLQLKYKTIPTHIHFEVQMPNSNKRVNPTKYLEKH